MNTEDTVKKQRGRPFVKGQSGNPNGRPLGSTNFETDFEEVVEVIAKRDHKTKSEVRQELLVVAYDMAKKGQFPFFKELIDRKYGKVPNKVDMTSKGEKIEFNPLMEEYAQNALGDRKKLTVEQKIAAVDTIPSLWVERNELVNESGLRLEFKKRKFLIDIYNDLSPKIAIMKSPQIGATVMNCLKAFYVAHELHKDLIYTLPTQSDVIDIVGGSFNRIIAQNDILKKWCADHDTVEQKAIGSNLIRFRGTFSMKQATMVPSSLNIHDEIDSSDITVITLYETRQEAQEGEENKWTWYFSHPSLAGHGVDIYYGKSDKKEFYITCDNGHEEYMEWPQSVDMGREVFVCKKCGVQLTDDQRINGRWINQDGIPWRGKIEGNYDVSGWHISQLFLFNKSAKDIIKAFNDPQKDKQYFYNYVLGLPYIGSEDRIDPSVVLKNCVDIANDYYDPNDTIAIGGDTGHGIHYTLMNNQGVFLYGNETEITASKDPYDKMRVFLNKFNGKNGMPYSIGIFDQGGDLIGVRKLQAEYPGRVYLVFYRKDRKSDETTEWGEGDKFGEIRVDRNREMTLMIEQLRDTGRFKLNGTKDDWVEFASHFGNIYREIITTDPKPGKDDRALYGSEYVWKRNGPDHWVHSTLYAMIGWRRFQNRQAKIFGARNAMSGIQKAEMVDANGMVRAKGVPSADVAQAVLLNWDK